MNVLSLYEKAQSTVLDARELAWVENEAREHPYFGLPYVISARHHLSQKTTIKDRALLLGAAYSIDRTMLHGYVQDLLQQPRAAKHVSVVATPVVPVLETIAAPVVEEDSAVVAASIVAPAVEEVPEIIAEAVAAPAVEEAPAIVAPAVEVAPEMIADAVVAPAVEETPVIVPEAVVAPAVEEAPEVIEAVVAPAVEEAPAIVTEGVAPAEQVTETPISPTPRTINWFLNMRMKLRTQKYASLPNRIRAAAAAHPARMATSAVSVAQAPAPSLPETPAAAPLTALQVESGKSAEDGYAIGAFSSFSFVETDDESPEGLEESLVMSPEAISMHTPTQPEENGEIILEEENRTVEIVVSPELLAKYFNGHLPAAHHVQAHTDSEVDNMSRMSLEFLPQETVVTPPAHQQRPSVTPTKRAMPSAQDLIDRFIEQEPSIKRQGGVDVPPGDLARESNVERDEWVTETLARIYAKQGNKNKAIKIYQKLGLLFPEKRDYFAARIAELK